MLSHLSTLVSSHGEMGGGGWDGMSLIIFPYCHMFTARRK